MQESYISLDPANADSMSGQIRARLFNQRVQEALGGQAGEVLSNQFALTTMLCSYTFMRGRGFRIMPFGASKLPAVAGLLAAGLVGRSFGSCYSMVVIGDDAQHAYLMENRKKIISGALPFDARQ